MKKIVSFIMAVVFSIAMCACVNHDTTEPEIEYIDTILVEETEVSEDTNTIEAVVDETNEVVAE